MKTISPDVPLCFACGRRLGASAKRILVDTRDAQEVYVGSECAKHVDRAGDAGWQPPQGGPRLYPVTAAKAVRK